MALKIPPTFYRLCSAWMRNDVRTAAKRTQTSHAQTFFSILTATELPIPESETLSNNFTLPPPLPHTRFSLLQLQTKQDVSQYRGISLPIPKSNLPASQLLQSHILRTQNIRKKHETRRIHLINRFKRRLTQILPQEN